MIDRLENIQNWWRSRRGALVDLDEILPYVVLHKTPAAGDLAPTPLFIGAKSLQRSLIGSHYAEDLRVAIGKAEPGYAEKALQKHRRVADEGRPTVERGMLDLSAISGGPRLHYVAGVFPVWTPDGAPLLLTYSAPITYH